MPTICAEAGLVPCAEEGIRHTFAMRLAARRMIGADREQSGIFALRAGIRLQRDRVITCHVAQPLLQPLEHRVIAAGLIGGRERMQAAELGPGQRAIISVVAFSFMVQEPSGIIARSSARSRSLSLRM